MNTGSHNMYGSLAYLKCVRRVVRDMTNAYDSHRVANFLFDKERGHVSVMVHASMREKTYPVQMSFSDSL